MSVIVVLIFVTIVLLLVAAFKSMSNLYGPETGNITQNNTSNQTPPIERRDGFIVLKPRTPSDNTSITNSNNYNNSFMKASKPAIIPKPIERINGAIVINPRASEPVSLTKPAVTTHYKPPPVPSVWGSAPRTNPPRAQQQQLTISPSLAAFPPKEYTNSMGIRLQVAPTASSSLIPTAAPTTSATSSNTPSSPDPVYARSSQESGQAHTALTIDDQTPTPAPAQAQYPQQPYSLEGIQFSSHPRPNVAIVIQDDENTNTSGSTSI
ncbi:hypothetical protein BGZ88_005206 [Linnemannia elongata]|nr:hypothetical protein BGZ88_005206 [Linnemannia elongata]